ncbi:MAG: PD-(D/E)XK nuclease family protein [Vulcanimicrobiaceae bacterium]
MAHRHDSIIAMTILLDEKPVVNPPATIALAYSSALPGAPLPLTPSAAHACRAIHRINTGSERVRIGIPHLSASQINAFARCPQAYEFSRILRLQSADDTKMLRGSAVHDGIAAGLTAVMTDGDPDTFLPNALPAAMETLAKAFARITEKKSPLRISKRWKKGPLDTPESLGEDVYLILTTFTASILPRLIPTSVEPGYIAAWNGNGALPFVGYADYIGMLKLDDDTWQHVVLDWKIGSKSLKALASDIALAFYGAAAACDTGRESEKIGYVTVTLLAPIKEKKKNAIQSTTPRIGIKVLLLPYEPERITRVAKHARDLTRSRAIGHYPLRENDQTCPTCEFQGECATRNGPLATIPNVTNDIDDADENDGV